LTYKPLPSCLTIRPSGIEGLGLFAVEDISAGTNLGISHVADPRYENGHIRTPLGGFYNHSENPNCMTLKQDNEILGPIVSLITSRDIKAGEELTSRYWLYEIG